MKYKSESLFTKYQMSPSKNLSELRALFQTDPNKRKDLPVVIKIISSPAALLEEELFTPHEGVVKHRFFLFNEILASIFLQLRISERSGRGVPKIVSAYGKEAIKIEKNRITVIIPFNKISVNNFAIVSNKVTNKVTNKTEDKIIELIRDNPTNLFKYKNFDELYNNHNKISIGYKEDEIANPDDMLMYYSKEDIEKYGVLGIELIKIGGER